MATTRSSNPIARSGRFILFLLTCGYLYPHVLLEDFDWKAYQDQIDKTPKG